MYCTVTARSNFVGARQRLTILRTEPHCSTIRHRRRTTYPTIQVRFCNQILGFFLGCSGWSRSTTSSTGLSTTTGSDRRVRARAGQWESRVSMASCRGLQRSRRS